MDPSAATLVQVLASPQASGEIYDTVADVSGLAKLAELAKNKLQVMMMAAKLRTLNRSVKKLLDLVDDVQSGKALVTEVESVSPQRLQNIVNNLDYLARMIDYLYEMARRAGLTNNSLTASGLATLRAYNEPLKDLVDWVDALSNPEQIESIFDRATRERKSREFVDLTRVE